MVLKKWDSPDSIYTSSGFGIATYALRRLKEQGYWIGDHDFRQRMFTGCWHSECLTHTGKRNECTLSTMNGLSNQYDRAAMDFTQHLSRRGRPQRTESLIDFPRSLSIYCSLGLKPNAKLAVAAISRRFYLEYLDVMNNLGSWDNIPRTLLLKTPGHCHSGETCLALIGQEQVGSSDVSSQ